MKCREFVEFLWKYFDDTLEAGERRTFDEHLARCPHCTSYLDSYRRTIALGKDALATAGLDSRVPDEVPKELVTAILAARKRDPGQVS